MSARGSKSQRSRTESERARLYAARTAWHSDQRRRRVRDNVVACVAGGVLVVAAVAGQFVHAAVTAEPEPVETSTPAPAPDVTVPPTTEDVPATDAPETDAPETDAPATDAPED